MVYSNGSLQHGFPRWIRKERARFEMELDWNPQKPIPTGLYLLAGLQAPKDPQPPKTVLPARIRCSNIGTCGGKFQTQATRLEKMQDVCDTPKNKA